MIDGRAGARWRAHPLCGPEAGWPEGFWGPERLDPAAWRELAARLDPAEELAALVAALRGARDVIDVGGGTGLLTRTLAAAIGPVTVVEPSAEQRAHLPAGLSVVPGRAEALPFADGAADAAVATWVLQYTDDPDAAVGELARVARLRVAIVQAAPGNQLVEIYNRCAAVAGLPAAHHGFLLAHAAARLEEAGFAVELTRIAIPLVAASPASSSAAVLADMLVRLHFADHPARAAMVAAATPLIASHVERTGRLADDGVLLSAQRR